MMMVSAESADIDTVPIARNDGEGADADIIERQDGSEGHRGRYKDRRCLGKRF